jgi:Uma2 family endonuclease
MTMTAFDHRLPWTEEEYLALGDTPDRVELFDGSLFVSPAPTFRHQTMARRLANILEPAAERAGLAVFEAVNIRLKPGRIPIPDVVLIHERDPGQLVGEARDVAMVCEITSTSNASVDRVLKMHHYAEAGISWYVLLDPEPVLLRLFRLEADKYAPAGEARPGEVLSLSEPIAVEIDPANLIR